MRGARLRSSCSECLGPIDTPFCGKCLLKELYYQMGDYRVNKKTNAAILREINREVTAESSRNPKCILCRASTPSLCSECLSQIITRIASKYFSKNGKSEGIIRNIDIQFLKKSI
jgi:predicted transcriptional regulator